MSAPGVRISGRLRGLATVVVAAALLTGTVRATGGSATDAFAAENAAAMDRMMAAMDIRPSGDIDADFAAMMIPHHQGAIDMAVAELRFGGNEQLRRIAQEIIVEQRQEIDAMHLALGQTLSASVASPTTVSPAADATRPALHAHLSKTP